jgi:predicted nucleic acid-binding protein
LPRAPVSDASPIIYLARADRLWLTRVVAPTGTLAILDDREAREGARSLHVPVIGTLGIILKAKSAGLIAAARPEVERLVEHGMYLSSQVLDPALALVGE